MSILKEKLLALSKQLDRKTVKLPDIGEFVLRELTARERIEYETFVTSKLDKYGRVKSSTALAAKLVQLGTENTDQQPVFGIGDYEAILTLSASIINEMAGTIAILSGIVSAEPQAGDDDGEDDDTELDEPQASNETDDPNDNSEL
jgi:hypothetical protein